MPPPHHVPPPPLPCQVLHHLLDFWSGVGRSDLNFSDLPALLELDTAGEPETLFVCERPKP